MYKKKRSRSLFPKLTPIAIAICLIAIIFIFLLLRFWIGNNYFVALDSTQEVRAIVASEFIIGETTRTEVENALYDKIFGNLDCYDPEVRTVNLDSAIGCEALASYDIIFVRKYGIFLGFSQDVLVEIGVRDLSLESK